MTHNFLGLSIAFAILWMVFAIPAHAETCYSTCSTNSGGIQTCNSQCY